MKSIFSLKTFLSVCPNINFPHCSVLQLWSPPFGLPLDAVCLSLSLNVEVSPPPLPHSSPPLDAGNVGFPVLWSAIARPLVLSR